MGKINRGNSKRRKYPIPLGDPAFDEDLLRDTYGYHVETDEPIDNAFRLDNLDLKNRRNRDYIKEQSDIFICYKDYLSDTHLSIREYGIIEEQFVEFW